MLLQRKKRKQYDFYEYADLLFGTLTRRYIALFNTLKNVSGYTDLEIVEAVNEVYKEADEVTRKYFLLLYKKIVKEICDFLDVEEILDTVMLMWLDEMLTGYDPVTKYVYNHEVDRKRARAIESLIASDNKPKEVETAKKQWSKQAKQYLDNIVADAVKRILNEADVKEVIWRTEEDLRVCAICEERDGIIYPLKDVPTKPHYGCRCWVEPI